MANSAQQPSKINVINSSAAALPNGEVKPTFSTMPISVQRGTVSHSVRVPIRPTDLRMANRVPAPRPELNSSNALRSNMILNVQPRPRFIPAPNSRYTSLPGPIHVTQLSGVPASNAPQLPSNWRPGAVPPNQHMGTQLASRPSANSNVSAMQSHPGLKFREAVRDAGRTSEMLFSGSNRPQPVAPRSNDGNSGAVRSQQNVGDSFPASRTRENDSIAEQVEVDSDAWPSEPKRQKLSESSYSANQNVAAVTSRRTSTSSGNGRYSGQSEQSNTRWLGERSKMRPKNRSSLPARRASNTTDGSEPETTFPSSQFSSQPQPQAAPAPLNPTTAAAGANGTASNPAQSTQGRNDSAQRRACNCSRSQCLKLYCECFAHSQFCSNCNCVDCHNTVTFESDRSAAIAATLERNPHAFQSKVGTVHGERRHTKGCNCKRSNCLKNYCECYEAKIACTPRCKCVDCQNYRDSQAIDVQYRSARTRRLFNFDRAVHGSCGSDHFAMPERSSGRSLGAAPLNARGSNGSPSAPGRLSAADRSFSRARAPRNRESGFDRNFDYGDMDEHEEGNDSGADAPQTAVAAGNSKLAGATRSRDLRILPSDLRVRSIVAREQARNRVLPQELISDEIVEATASCLIARATNNSTLNQDPTQRDAVKFSETQLERSVLEEFGRCVERVITIAKQKQEIITAEQT